MSKTEREISSFSPC